MNKRIKELLAELDIDLYTDEGVMMTKILVRPKDLRQFAELIVRECAEICMKEFDTGLLMAPQAPWIAKQIKEHFGVEDSE